MDAMLALAMTRPHRCRSSVGAHHLALCIVTIATTGIIIVGRPQEDDED